MSDKIYKNLPWNPDTTKAARDLINRIHGVAPELEVTFMGAAALGIAGKNDLDLDIICPPKELVRYKTLFEKELGPAMKDLQDTEYWKFMPDEVYWEFNWGGFIADVMLHDAQNKHYVAQTSRHKKLSNSKELLERYTQLKQGANGLTMDGYERRKLRFFEEVVDRS